VKFSFEYHGIFYFQDIDVLPTLSRIMGAKATYSFFEDISHTPFALLECSTWSSESMAE
jgi:hypothetical protein